ncbi:MAG: hypothetical protein Q9220_001963 [cf. Caloplaca sp. 1 TL-2023]
MQFEHPHSFTLIQSVADNDGLVDSASKSSPLPITGEIHVRLSKLPPRHRSIWVETDVRGHDPALVDISPGPNNLVIVTPSVTYSTERHSLHLVATIWISKGLPLSFLHIGTASLSVTFHDEIPLPNHTPISIIAPSTPVHISSNSLPSALTIDAASTTLSSQSGSVQGDFTLRDNLTIHTISGSININLLLAPSATNTTTPATLDLRARSGSIKVNTPSIFLPAKIPAKRDYHSNIVTNSGTISASLVHGTHTYLRSDSSSIHVSLYPFGVDGDVRSEIASRVISGSTDITVHPSLSNATARLRNLHANHRAVSGSIRLHYPSTWEGTVEGHTTSGSIRVDWPGLQLTEERGGWFDKRLRGVKGMGKGMLGFRAVSGSVSLMGGVEVVAAVQREEEKEEVEKESARVAEKKEEESTRIAEENVQESTRPAENGHPANSDDDDTETEEAWEQQAVLTPRSEAGDEWQFVQ